VRVLTTHRILEKTIVEIEQNSFFLENRRFFLNFFPYFFLIFSLLLIISTNFNIFITFRNLKRILNFIVSRVLILESILILQGALTTQIIRINILRPLRLVVYSAFKKVFSASFIWSFLKVFRINFGQKSKFSNFFFGV